MIVLLQLEQLAAFAEHDTLSKAADELHMSQPTLTRSMQKIESEFGVCLFHRTKNKLALNENGKLAADYARKILDQTRDMLNLVHACDRASRTLSFGTCAPMPVLTLVSGTKSAQRRCQIPVSLSKANALLSMNWYNHPCYRPLYQM